MSFLNYSDIKEKKIEQEIIQEQDEDNRERISIFPKNEIIDNLLSQNYDFENKFICSKCKEIPSINFSENKEIFIKLSCGCNKKPISVSIKNANNYINFLTVINDNFNKENEEKQTNDKNPIYYFKCERHSDFEKNNNEKGIYRFYCFSCKKNLCDICYSLHICSGEKSQKFHDFLKVHSTMVDKIKYIHKCIFENNSFILDWKELDIELQNIFKRLVAALIMQYYYTPDYTSINNLDNFHQFLSKTKGNEKLDIENNIEIYSIKEYQRNISNQYNISKIQITNDCFDINLLENAKLENLKILNLSKNNLVDINPLTKIEFNQLIELNLSLNKLKDNMIKSLFELNFPKLEKLDLSFNLFTSYRILKSIEHFEKLIYLNLCSNVLKIENNENFDEDIKYDFKSLETIILSNGVFSEENLENIIKRIKFQKIKLIDLSSNHLKTLSFLKYLKDYPIETLILNNNEINDSELNQLECMKTLARIEIRNNEIENLNGLHNIEYFKNLKMDIFENKVRLLDDTQSIKIEKDQRLIIDYFEKTIKIFEKDFK